jgi:hypothetical protein
MCGKLNDRQSLSPVCDLKANEPISTSTEQIFPPIYRVTCDDIYVHIMKSNNKESHNFIVS